MTIEQFQDLPNRRIKFTTYTGKVYVGGNYVDYASGNTEYYIITDVKNYPGMTKEEKIKKGILIPIKPAIIEEAIVIQ